jgi:hypothetical protein
MSSTTVVKPATIDSQTARILNVFVSRGFTAPVATGYVDAPHAPLTWTTLSPMTQRTSGIYLSEQ